jgi:Zn-dependent M28 family amino/carboxypeptidase
MEALRQFAAILLLTCSLCACVIDRTPLPVPASAQNSIPAATQPPPESKRTARAVVNGARTMQYVREIIAYGPRYLGSPGHKKVEDYLRSRLKNDSVEYDTFNVESPEGNFPGRNIIAKFPGTKDGIIVIASHYDTNYPLRKTSFIGANDGAATSALLLELAQHLRGSKLEGYSVWLLWTDAEEAVRTWTATDSLYGTRHLAAVWEKDGTLKRIKAFLLADMIGDADLDIQRDSNSTPWVEDLVLEAATRLGYQSHFFVQSTSVNDDHLPFAERGVPVADIIDIDYGYNNVFHHTTLDTIDKLSPRSLEISGDVIWETVQLVNERK